MPPSPETARPHVLVTGAGGFIGHHLVNFLKEKGYWVRGVDIKEPGSLPPPPTSLNCSTSAVGRLANKLPKAWSTSTPSPPRA